MKELRQRLNCVSCVCIAFFAFAAHAEDQSNEGEQLVAEFERVVRAARADHDVERWLAEIDRREEHSTLLRRAADVVSQAEATDEAPKVAASPWLDASLLLVCLICFPTLRAGASGAAAQTLRLLGAVLLAAAVLALSVPSYGQGAVPEPDSMFVRHLRTATDLLLIPKPDRAIAAIEAAEDGPIALPEIEVKSAYMKPFRKFRVGSSEAHFTLAALQNEMNRPERAEEHVSSLLASEERFPRDERGEMMVRALALYLLDRARPQEAGILLAHRADRLNDPANRVELARRLADAGVAVGIEELGLRALGSRRSGGDAEVWAQLAQKADSRRLMERAWERGRRQALDSGPSAVARWMSHMDRGSVREVRASVLSHGIGHTESRGGTRQLLAILLGSASTAASTDRYLRANAQDMSMTTVVSSIVAACDQKANALAQELGKVARTRDRRILGTEVLAASPIHGSSLLGEGRIPMSLGIFLGACNEAAGQTYNASRYYSNTLTDDLKALDATSAMGDPPNIVDVFHVASFFWVSSSADQRLRFVRLMEGAAVPHSEAQANGRAEIHRRWTESHPELEAWAIALEALRARHLAQGDETRGPFLPDGVTADYSAEAVPLLIEHAETLAGRKIETKAALGVSGGTKLVMLLVLVAVTYLCRSSAAGTSTHDTLESIAIDVDRTRILQPFSVLWAWPAAIAASWSRKGRVEI